MSDEGEKWSFSVYLAMSIPFDDSTEIVSGF